MGQWDIQRLGGHGAVDGQHLQVELPSLKALDGLDLQVQLPSLKALGGLDAIPCLALVEPLEMLVLLPSGGLCYFSANGI